MHDIDLIAPPHCVRSACQSILIVLLTLFPAFVRAQLTGYASTDLVSDANPLFNYQHVSDAFSQTSLNLEAASSGVSTRIQGQYSGTLTCFRRFEDRNYLDHTLQFQFFYRPLPASALHYAIPPGGDSTPGDTLDTVNPDDLDEYDPATDTLLYAWRVALLLGARHDKAPFSDFNNRGAAATLGYVLPVSSSLSLDLSTRADVRIYPEVQEMSNATEEATITVSTARPASFRWHALVTAGWKWYLKTTYDTSRYEPVRTYRYLPGKGKLGGVIKESSGKEVLLNAASTHSSQLTAQAGAETQVGPVAFGATLRYRWNPIAASRRLAQNAAGSLLTDDLYKDYFSYHGPTVNLHGSVDIGWGLRTELTLGGEQRKFSLPALTLANDVLPEDRSDEYGIIEARVVKKIALAEQHPLEIALGGAWLRNRSNDAYNDYSSNHYSLEVAYDF